jgi:hypothetical protein
MKYEFDKWYSSYKEIINKNIDMIIYLIPQEHFLGIIRSALLLMDVNNEIKNNISSSIDFKLNKQELVNSIVDIIPKFKTYLVISLYSYL